jgi:hypothetical protein
MVHIGHLLEPSATEKLAVNVLLVPLTAHGGNGRTGPALSSGICLLTIMPRSAMVSAFGVTILFLSGEFHNNMNLILLCTTVCV